MAPVAYSQPSCCQIFRKNHPLTVTTVNMVNLFYGLIIYYCFYYNRKQLCLLRLNIQMLTFQIFNNLSFCFIFFVALNSVTCYFIIHTIFHLFIRILFLKITSVTILFHITPRCHILFQAFSDLHMRYFLKAIFLYLPRIPVKSCLLLLIRLVTVLCNFSQLTSPKLTFHQFPC